MEEELLARDGWWFGGWCVMAGGLVNEELLVRMADGRVEEELLARDGWWFCG